LRATKEILLRALADREICMLRWVATSYLSAAIGCLKHAVPVARRHLRKLIGMNAYDTKTSRVRLFHLYVEDGTMLRDKLVLVAMLCVAASCIAGCGHPGSGTGNASSSPKRDDERVLNLFWWSDFLAPDTITNFEKQTGIKVTISYYDSEEVLETRMLTGKSGFDVVVPAAPYFFQRQTRSGAYLTLDKAKLPNLANLDPGIMSRVALSDPNNAHGVVYMWGTIGIGYNEEKVALASQRMPIDSWRVVFDPASASKLAKCGIQILDSPTEVVPIVLRYLGRTPASFSPQDLDDVERVLMAIRPYIRNIDTTGYLEAIANGDVCLVVGYNGDFVQARRRAREANNGVHIAYAQPKEGSIVYFNMLAIPRDAPHAANAHLFLNYMMKPQVIADVTNFVAYANANVAATPLLDPSIANDTASYPTPAQRELLFVQTESTPEQARVITRLWQKFKTAQ
jgi:putrescine transport system substrate-binding protein